MDVARLAIGQERLTVTPAPDGDGRLGRRQRRPPDGAAPDDPDRRPGRIRGADGRAQGDRRRHERDHRGRADGDDGARSSRRARARRPTCRAWASRWPARPARPSRTTRTATRPGSSASRRPRSPTIAVAVVVEDTSGHGRLRGRAHRGRRHPHGDRGAVSFEPGELIGDRYELGRQLGAGGMARVYLGHDRLLDRRVAVKVLSEPYASDPSFVERFRREASSAAGLNHPNIVAVYDRGRGRRQLLHRHGVPGGARPQAGDPLARAAAAGRGDRRDPADPGRPRRRAPARRRSTATSSRRTCSSPRTATSR